MKRKLDHNLIHSLPTRGQIREALKKAQSQRKARRKRTTGGGCKHLKKGEKLVPGGKHLSGKSGTGEGAENQGARLNRIWNGSLK